MEQEEIGERPRWFLSWLQKTFIPQQRDAVDEQMKSLSTH